MPPIHMYNYAKMSYKVIGYLITSTTQSVTSFKIASSIMHDGHATSVGSVLTSPLSTLHMFVLVGEKLLGSVVQSVW